MSETMTADQDLEMFVGYFEEPEPGVPQGHSGWYHSGGRFEVRGAEQIFWINGHERGLVREEAAGPFACRQEAIEDLVSKL
jgi:hypothetical protein